MEDLEQKLSELLSSPDSMAQLMAAARALSGGNGADPPAPAPDSGNAPQEPGPGFDLPDLQTMTRIMGLMNRLSAPRDDKRTALLTALRPWLSPQRRQKLDRALQMMQMTAAARTALQEFQGGDSTV